MAAAKIAAVDFNKMTSKWRYSTGLFAAMFVGENLLANRRLQTLLLLWLESGRKMSREYLIYVYSGDTAGIDTEWRKYVTATVSPYDVYWSVQIVRPNTDFRPPVLQTYLEIRQWKVGFIFLAYLGLTGDSVILFGCSGHAWRAILRTNRKVSSCPSSSWNNPRKWDDK